MGDTIVIETPVATVLEVAGLQGPQGPTGPQGPAGDVSGSVAWSNVTGKPATFTPSAHTHTASEVTDFNSAVVAAAPPTTNASLLTSGTLADARLSAAVTTSLGKADTASQPGHTHAVADVTGLQAALDGKQASGSYAAASHTHTPSEVGLGNVSNAAQVTSVSGTAPIVSSGGTTPAISVTVGTTANTVCAGDDARLSDARTPASHTHGNITNGGFVGTTSGLPLKTGTGGIVEAGAFGTSAGQFAEGNHTHTNFPSLRIDPANGNVGSLVVGSTTSGQNNYVTIDNKIRLLSPSNSFVVSLDSAALSANRSIALPDASGTLMLNNIGSTSGLPLVTTTAGAITTLALGSAGQVLKVNSGGTAVEFGAAGGVTSGSVDNAILRADGTGGSTSQGSAFIIADNATASPNNTVNHASIQATGDTTNVSVSIVPKGTGAFMLRVPDAASTGGNARGANAVDLQTSRSAATQVASGQESVVCGGVNNTASATQSVVCGGSGNTASGFQSAVLGGRNNTANNDRCFAFGDGNTASSTNAVAFGAGNTASTAQALAIGSNSRADRNSFLAHAAGAFSSAGDAQRVRAVLRNKTTTNSAVELFLDGSSARLTAPSGKVIAMIVNITGVKSDGSAVAHYVRQYAIKNVGGTTSEVYAPVTIGTDNAASTSIALSANDTNDALKIECTGIASETWRWVASVDAVEVAYGT